jgi:hypothetical protein
MLVEFVGGPRDGWVDRVDFDRPEVTPHRGVTQTESNYVLTDEYNGDNRIMKYVSSIDYRDGEYVQYKEKT